MNNGILTGLGFAFWEYGRKASGCVGNMIAVNYVLEHNRILKADSMFPRSQGSGKVEQTADMKDFKPSSAHISMFDSCFIGPCHLLCPTDCPLNQRYLCHCFLSDGIKGKCHHSQFGHVCFSESNIASFSCCV